MKNIQIIDDADNCVFDIFQATEEEFLLIFPNQTNIAFSEDVWANNNSEALKTTFSNIWQRPIRKVDAMGIHGTLFYGLQEKKKYYPTLKDEEASNPDGTALR